MKEVFKSKVIQKGANKGLDILHKPYYLTKINKFKVGDIVYITLDTRKPKRTVSQNNLYFLYLENIGKETGNDKDYLHRHFTKTHGVKESVSGKLNGIETVETIYKSTSEYNKGEFTEYMNSIQSDTGIPIPDTELFMFGDVAKTEEQIRENYPENTGEEPKF